MLGIMFEEAVVFEEPIEPFSTIIREICRICIGYEHITKLVLACMLAEGHVLLLGPWGIGKTTFAKNFAKAIGGTFRRIQGTPDLLPSDILGCYVYDQQRREFVLKKGPIFTNILMIDEINRLSPRTQSALLEAMQERQVSIEGTTIPLPRPFLVIATQLYQSIEEVGVMPLPKIQRDRFLISIPATFPPRDIELKVLKEIYEIERGNIRQVATCDEIVYHIQNVVKVHVHEDVYNYILDIVNEFRNIREIEPLSVRASIAILKMAKAWAYIHGRDYVVPDDVKAVTPYALYHRILPKRGYELSEEETADLIKKVLNRVPAPR